MLAAFEAGGHVAWAQLFSHPQRIAAAALVTPNYIGRCVDEANIPHFAEHRMPPVRAFAGGRDSLWSADSPIRGQWLRARALALAHGFQSLTEIVVPDKGHELMASELLEFLDSASRR
jgi:pimeloyl-ACP methyl ester carboxylesterase